MVSLREFIETKVISNPYYKGSDVDVYIDEFTKAMLMLPYDDCDLADWNAAITRAVRYLRGETCE